MGFVLDTRLAADGPVIGDLALCRVILKNDARWPWVILVPRIGDLREMHELDEVARQNLLSEMLAVSAHMAARPSVLKVNVGALGNIVSQLHVHVIGRNSSDPAWPGPAWGAGVASPFEQKVLAQELGFWRSALPITLL